MEIEQITKLMEVSGNITSLTIFTFVICYAILEWIKAEKEVKKAIVREKDKNV